MTTLTSPSDAPAVERADRAIRALGELRSTLDRQRASFTQQCDRLVAEMTGEAVTR